MLRYFPAGLTILLLLSLAAAGQCPDATITVQIFTDDFGEETSWEIFDQNTSTLIADGDNYVGNMLYTEQVCVSSSDCFMFMIHDMFNDGMCCTYGNGYYNVFYNGMLIRNGGVFTTSQTTFGIGNNCSNVTTSITTDNTTYTPQQLVQDVLLGSCVEAFNITASGSTQARGYFANGNPLGITSGILLSTGTTTNARGPNSSSSISSQLLFPGDADLNAAAGVSSLDAVSLEFDFVSQNDSVVFRYIFASEEYPEFVCSPFNDAFAFLVNGIGYAPNTNVAIIPGTNIPVEINSVNSGSAGGVNNPANCASLGYSNFYRTNITPSVTQYDAFTNVLTATMVVVPCDTYHIKFVIADVGDYQYDSGVFIEAQSFSGGESIGISVSSTEGIDDAYEGCTDGSFYFFREGNSPSTDAVTINFTVSGIATEGVDFPIIPHSITIPANEDSAQLSISPILDAIPEGTETVILTYPDACACGLFKSDTLFLLDNAPLTVNIIAPDTICPAQTAAFAANAAGSVSLPFTYQWNTGQQTNSFNVAPAASTLYTVTVTDACGGQTATASHLLIVLSDCNACDTLFCADANFCTTDTCVNGTCVFIPLVCDDGNGCTTDACVAGVCIFTSLDCDDGDPCTVDQCINTVCRHTNATLSTDSLVVNWWKENCCCR